MNSLRAISSFFLAAVLPAQQAAAPASLTLGQAVESALKNYPSIRVTGNK